MTALQHERPRAIAPAIGFQVWLFLLVAFAGTTLPAADSVLRAVVLVVFAVPAIAWTILRPPASLGALDVAILLAVAAHLIVALFSLDREGSLEASGIVIAYAATFWLARRIGSEPRLRRVSTIAVATALVFWLTVVAITWLVEKAVDVGAFGWPPRLDAHLPWVWGSINTPPILLMLAVPFAVWLPGRRIRRTMLLALAILSLVIVPFSVGRAAWFGIVVAAISLELLLGFPVSRRLGRRGGLRWPVIGALSVAVLAAAAFLVSRFGDVSVTIDSRLRLWNQALGLFGADPLTGSGPSTFSWARLNHVPDLTDRVAASAAHNVAMETLAEGGLTLAAALLLIIVTWAWTVGRGRHRLAVGQRVAMASLIGYATFALLDDLSFLPSVTVVLIILAAWSLPESPVEPRDTQHAGRRPRVLIAAILLTACLIAAPSVVALGVMRAELDVASTAALEGRWADALPAFERATAAQPSNAQHWMSLGLAHGVLGERRAAAEAYEVAAAVNPADPRPWGALASLESDPPREGDLLRQAAVLSNDPQYAYRLGVLLIEQGRSEEAREWLAIASVIRPDLYAALDPDIRFEVRSALPGAIARIGSIAGRDPSEVLWNAALAADDVAADAPVQWQVASRLDAGDLPEARRLLTTALAAEPRALRTHQVAAAVARAGCDREAFEVAQRHIELLGGREASGSESLQARRVGLYGVPELGDYQPPDDEWPPAVPDWPLGLIEAPDCGW